MISAKYGFAVVVAVLAVACTKTETSSTTTAQSSTTVSAQPPATTSSAAAVPAPQPATGGALATTDGEQTGTRIDITELKRTSGGTLNLKFVLVNNTGKELGLSNHWLGDSSISKGSYRDVSGIHLIDPVNKKKYFAVTDAEKNCVCSSNIGDVKEGSQVNFWAKFPAPPADVQKVTIEIPHFQPIDDVPIQ